jgi:hypothetical protein
MGGWPKRPVQTAAPKRSTVMTWLLAIIAVLLLVLTLANPGAREILGGLIGCAVLIAIFVLIIGGIGVGLIILFDS